ncbi:DUF4270 domain-containing protein [Dysgonomonadaceae bacterium zrk40]|nr:DUF4270 domain-containing protein [Dysgonomonadaceae bacterium zrk40]
MKPNSLYKVLIVALLSFMALSCDDTLDQVGFSIQPGMDSLTVGIDTMHLKARTIQLDSIFGRTKYPVLGEYLDPVFGSVKSEFMGEFYLPEGSEFKPGAHIDSVRVVVSYTNMMGDSLAPMELSAYELNRSLKGVNNYTHINPEEYAEMSAPLGKTVFTGKNNNYHTEYYNSGYGNTESYNVYDISVNLPLTIGERFLNEYKKPGHGKMSDLNSFREFFPGLYFTTSFGNSTIINVNYTTFYVHYHYTDVKGSSTGQDTTRTDAMRLYITPDVTQINTIRSNNQQLLEESDSHTYVKSPAGVVTEITFPFSDINQELESRALNLANFSFSAMPEATEDPLVKISPPDYLLLINRDSLAGFFEKNKLPDNVTSFLSDKFDATTYSYDFNNISAMMNYYNRTMGENPKDLVYYLVPVDATITTSQQSYYSSGTQTLTDLQNQMWPTAAKLDKREGNLKIELIFSNY